MYSETVREQSRVAIVGAGLGGLSAAIHLRIRGFEVTIYEANDQVGGRAGQISAGGFTFDTGPTLLNYPWVFEGLFKAAGRKLSDYVELIPIDPSIRYYWPDGQTLALSASITTLVKEFERAEPGSGPGLFAFMADAAEKYRLSFDSLVARNFDHIWQWIGAATPLQWMKLGVWRSFDRELRRFFRARHILDALGSYAMYLGGSPHQLPGIFAMLPYGELAMGLWLPRGGIYGLIRAIENLARELGVRIETGRKVREIRIHSGAVDGLEFTDASEIRCPLIVSNVDVPTTQSTLLSGLSKSTRAPRMTPSVMTFYLGVRGKVAGGGHHMIFMPGDAEFGYRQLVRTGEIPRELPFYVSIASESDASLAPAGGSAVFILIPLPLSLMSSRVDWQALASELKCRVIERLRTHGIKLDPSDAAVELTLTPADWAARCGLFHGSAFGSAHTLFQMGYFRQPNRDRGVRGLYYVGASTVPGTGLPMVTLGGRMTAERIAADVH